MSLGPGRSILLIDDNDGDVELMKELLADAVPQEHLHVVGNGEEALNFLRKQGSFADSPDVDIVILDLSLPGKSGYEVLREIKSDDGLRSIPVIVLTGSNSQTDISMAYRLGANAYVVKPVMFKELSKAVETLSQFWLRTAALARKA